MSKDAAFIDSEIRRIEPCMAVFLIARSNYIATFPSITRQSEQLLFETVIKPAMVGKNWLTLISIKK